MHAREALVRQVVAFELAERLGGHIDVKDVTRERRDAADAALELTQHRLQRSEQQTIAAQELGTECLCPALLPRWFASICSLVVYNYILQPTMTPSGPTCIPTLSCQIKPLTLYLLNICCVPW